MTEGLFYEEPSQEDYEQALGILGAQVPDVPETRVEIPANRPDASPLDLLTCPLCRGGEFVLRRDGTVICADQECFAVRGTWRPS